ncbi:YqaA family protein [Rheinheimera hassiensis]|uniref:YqaA family protein n=1 Tax=Rheinheimera hassiensis TaxID=1193627 RepID=UPI0023D9D8A3|nr:YqaA family protein [Rheinheimera hassiensis]
MLAYFSLFCSGLLAATLFPASSEIVLLALLQQGYNPLWLFIAATAGNTLGSCVNWYLGLKLLNFQHKRWFAVSAAALSRAQQQFQRFGSWSLLFAWLPVVGDPLTFVAGVLKVRFKVFLLLVLVGKAARYAILIGLGNLWLV